MKNFIRTKIVEILSSLSRQTLAKYEPIVIGVTGNIGKTTTKDYIYNFLKYKFKEEVRASEKSQNSEFGVNLTILGEENQWSSISGWAKVIVRNWWRVKTEDAMASSYPKTLVLEVGADKPGDISYITSIVTPDVVVLTAFQKSPTHGEYFLNIEQHINEKKVLVDNLKENGVIIYNSDDEVMTKMAQDKNAQSESVKIFSFGYNANSNVTILENSNLYDENAEIVGIKLKYGINFGGPTSEVELRLLGVLGDAHAYSIVAGLCVAILNGMSKGEVVEAVKEFEFSKSRMRILQGVNGSKIVDDSYNSSPKAAINAIETISKILTKGKKIAILGHMAELGEKTKEEHFKIGLLASKYFDSIILSGKYNEYFLEGIREGKFDLAKVYLAEKPKEVLEHIRNNDLVKENDLVLVKGSQSARLEKVVVKLLENPRDAKFVCRQDKEWHKR